MQKQVPSPGRIAVMLVFALSCFALLLYLWTTFGGPVPLAPKGYRVEVRFDEATQLADNADVRISGVNVGRVVRSELDRDRTRAILEIDDEFAPIPRNTKAILRLKTLLGETYVEITPGSRRSGDMPDGGTLPDAQVKPTTELDEVLRAFDPRTRRDLRRFLTGLGDALEGRSGDLSAALGNAGPFAEDTRALLDVLDSQRGAVRRLVRDTGTVFGALGQRQGELSSLVASLDTVLQTTAARNRDLEETVRLLPPTLRELRPTLAEVEGLAGDAAPVVSALRPSGRALAPTLQDAAQLAPELRRLFLDVDQVTQASRRALPAATRTVEGALPLFRQLDPTLAELQPVLDYLGLYRREVAATFSNVAAATQGTERTGPGREPVHYLRALVPLTAEGFLVNERRAGSNRHNPYPLPGWMDKLATGLESIDCSNTGNGGIPQPAPPCKVQEPLEFRGRRTQFPQLRRDP